MKRKFIFLSRAFIAGAIIAFLTSCRDVLKNSEFTSLSQNAIAALSDIKLEIQNDLNQLRWSLDLAARTLGKHGINGEKTRMALDNLYNAHDDLVDCGTISMEGKIQEIGPSEYRSIGGKALKQMLRDKPKIVEEIKAARPFMSGAFKTGKGYLAVAMSYPVKNPDGKLLGCVYLLFIPKQFIEKTVKAEMRRVRANIWVIQRNGLILYDRDPEEVGLNILTDDFYKPYISLRELTKEHITKSAVGFGNYSFPSKVEKREVSKIAKWVSVEMFGVSWRIILNPEDSSMDAMM